MTELKRNEYALKRSLETLRKSIGAITQAMSVVVESRDPYTAGHQKRVAALARAMAQEMHLSPDQVDAVRMAGTLQNGGLGTDTSHPISRGQEMGKIVGKKGLSLMAALAMFFLIAVPVTAAEKTFEVKIPGCTA